MQNVINKCIGRGARIMSYIYKTTNSINGMIYIGKTKFNNKNYLGSGIKITNAIKKYGKENFTREIIEECEDSEVSQREIFWIAAYKSTEPLSDIILAKAEREVPLSEHTEPKRKENFEE